MQRNPPNPHQTSNRIATQTTILADGSYRTVHDARIPSPTAPQNAGHSAWAPSSSAIREPINIFVDENLLQDVEVRLETSSQNVVSIHINRRQPPVVALPSAILPSELLGSAPRGSLPRSGLVALPSGTSSGGEAVGLDTVSLIEDIRSRLEFAMQTLSAVVHAPEHGGDGDAGDDASEVDLVNASLAALNVQDDNGHVGGGDQG